MKCIGGLFIGLFMVIGTVQAQITPDSVREDTLHTTTPIIVKSDTVIDNSAALIESYAKRYNPRKAGLYSAVVPGLGQAYNKKYWKMPIVYGGFIGLGFGINFYQMRHKKFRTELFGILKSGELESTSGFDEEQLRTIVDKARRERDFFIVLTGILYLLNVVDAHIDSHLKEFDLNEKLKLTLDPMLRQQNQLQAGLTLNLSFH